MTGSRGSQFLFRQVRSVLNKEVGFNPLAIQRKADNYIENIMVAKKEDCHLSECSPDTCASYGLNLESLFCQRIKQIKKHLTTLPRPPDEITFPLKVVSASWKKYITA